MKVLHLIAGGDAGGARTHLLDLLTQLHTKEDVLLACLGDGVLAREARDRGLRVEVLSGDFFAGVKAAKALAQTADILHCHGSRANLTGALAKSALSCPVISTVHSDHRLDYLGRPAARLSYGSLNALSLRRMDGLFCVSEAMRQIYIRRGFDPARLYAVYNGVDFSLPLPPADRNALFAGAGFVPADTDVIVGTAARFHPVKDLSTLLRGFALAAAREPRLKLVLAGAGPEEERLKALTRKLDLTRRVHFPGWLEDTDTFYASIDISVLSSRSETFPYALTHAARQGKPAVATAVGGIPELIESGVNGFLFSPGDAQGLAAALTALSDDALRRQMGEALRETTRQRFSLAATAEAQRRIYEHILGRN